MLHNRTLAVLMVLALLLALNGGTVVRTTFDFPRLTLWAWERPGQLRFLTSSEVAVAFLARSVYLTGKPRGTTDCCRRRRQRAREGDSLPKKLPLDVIQEEPMQVVYARCAGLDVHKKTVSACVSVCEPEAAQRQQTRVFGTFTCD